MKGACRKRGGRLPTRPLARLPLPPRPPRSPGARAPRPPTTGRWAEPRVIKRPAGPGLGLGAVSTRGEEAVHDPRPHGPTLRGRGVMLRAQGVKDAGNASAGGTCTGRGHGDPSSSLRFKTGCLQHGRREKGSAGGGAGPGGRPHGNRKPNCQPGVENSRSRLSKRTGRAAEQGWAARMSRSWVRHRGWGVRVG